MPVKINCNVGISCYCFVTAMSVHLVTSMLGPCWLGWNGHAAP